MDTNIEKEMKALLYNFWITKDENQDLYYKIKHNQNKIKDFVSKNLGSNLIFHDRFVKLEKVPTIMTESAKIEQFSSTLDYVILMIILMFLEDKTREDMFVLSDLIEYIKNTAVTLELDNVPDWNKVAHRRSLINVINFLKELYVIKAKDEGNVSFTDDINAEALYETMGTSNYVMRIFDFDINDLSTPQEFIKNEFIAQEEEKGNVRRYRVFRNILYTPAVFSKDVLPNDEDYIRKNRAYIKNEIDKNLNMDIEITHNMALLLDNINSIEKNNFPNTKKITEIVLMINTKILDDIKSGKLILDDFETVTIQESYLEAVIKQIKIEKEPYIGKTFGALTDEKFYKEVLNYMKRYHFIKQDRNEITIYPTIGRLIGKTCEVKMEKEEQISLFGGNDEL